MKKRANIRNKYSAEKDSKSLRKIYLSSVQKDAEKVFPPFDAEGGESRRDYFKRLNDHIGGNKDVYDAIAPFGQDAIDFVGTIPEDDLSSMEKDDRLNFVKWVAGSYKAHKNILTLDNVLKIKSFIDVMETYKFSSINDNDPAFYLNEISEQQSRVQDALGPAPPSTTTKRISLDSEKFQDAKEAISVENYPDIKEMLSDEEIFFLQAGAVLTDNINNLSLIMDFLAADNSDIEVSKPGDLSSLYPFDLSDKESITSSFESLNMNQEGWHEKMSLGHDAEDSKEDGDFGYGYKTNIIIHSFDDGWKIVYLPSKGDSYMIPWEKDAKLSHDRIQEGDNNSLCLGSNSKMYNDNNSGFVYSLRDPSNKPIATLRLSADLRVETDFTNKNFSIKEIRESNNRNPGIESSIYLTSFFDKLNVSEYSYNYAIKKVSYYSVSNLKNISKREKWEPDYQKIIDSENLFEWIYFLNKNRENEKYKEYLQLYGGLIGARDELFSSSDGLFVNTASITKDESRVRKYLTKIFQKINREGSASFVSNSLVSKLFSGKIDNTAFKTLYSEIISKLDNYRNAYSIMSTEFPKTVFGTLARSGHWSIEEELLKGGEKSGRILVSGSKEDIDIFFKALKVEYRPSFLEKISGKYTDLYKSSQDIREYLEHYFAENQKDFIKFRFYLYYYGDNKDITSIRSKISNEKIKEHLEKMNNNTFYSQADLLRWITYAGPNIDVELGKSMAFFCEEKIEKDAAADSAKYLGVYFRLKNILKDIDFKFSNHSILKKYFDEKVRAIFQYTDVDNSTKYMLDEVKAFGLFNMPEEASLILNDLFGDHIKKIKDNKPNVNSFMQMLFLKNALSVLSRDTDLGFGDLEDLAVESGDRVMQAFSSNPSRYFESKIYLYDEYSTYSIDMLGRIIGEPMIYTYGSRDTAREAEVVSGYIFTFLKESKNKKSIIDYMDYDLSATVDLFIDNLSSYSKDTDERSLKTMVESYTYLVNLLTILSKNKYFDVQSSVRKINGAIQIISNIANENPRAYYYQRLYSVPGIKVDRRQIANNYINDLVSRDMYDDDKASMILNDLGLTRKAMILGKYLIKNSFINELRVLSKIFSEAR